MIGTAVEGLPDTLAAGRGVLVPPDDPEALAAAIKSVISGAREPDLAGARRYAESFKPAAVAAAYASAYRALLSSGVRKSGRDQPVRVDGPVSAAS